MSEETEESMSNPTTQQPTLPDKPSALIRLALADLKKVEAQPDKYVVDMYIWHTRYSGFGCHVCLAGAVMAGTLGASRYSILEPDDYDVDIKFKLNALDDFRIGDIAGGFNSMDLPVKEGRKFDRDNIDYEDDPQAFHADMNKLADDLEAAGY